METRNVSKRHQRAENRTSIYYRLSCKIDKFKEPQINAFVFCSLKETYLIVYFKEIFSVSMVTAKRNHMIRNASSRISNHKVGTYIILRPR